MLWNPEARHNNFFLRPIIFLLLFHLRFLYFIEKHKEPTCQKMSDRPDDDDEEYKRMLDLNGEMAFSGSH